MEKKLLFALDIGTRSVVGLVGEQQSTGIRLVASERLEHHTRAMLDGQIHDVPEVATVLLKVKEALEKSCGPLTKVSIAAAGRALCTIKASAEIETGSRGALTRDDEASLELAAIQSAQQKLATSGAVADPTGYYCVGYSVVSFGLDGSPIKSLVGQRGKLSSIELIATFLPRPVIDSLQSALEAVGLEMATLTLEPIAAINVLIPPTMRHLNLALVDVGAGTSDVAVTRGGSVIGYGMVPCAGDEITEAISQKYLLDFNVAETVKRHLTGKSKKVAYTDVLGMAHKTAPEEIVQSIAITVTELAQAIAAQILELNGAVPQAVLLVGGGSLTPRLPEILAETLELPVERVAIRKPESVEGINAIPASLSMPDAVTPLGILKLSGADTLNFIQVTVNDRALRLFNLGKLSVADALLTAGIEIRSLHGRPGLGITVTVNGKKQFLPGTYGQPGQLVLNGSPGKLTDPLNDGDQLIVTRGVDGIVPKVQVSDLVDIPLAMVVSINGKNTVIAPVLTCNGEPVTGDTVLADRDQVVCRLPGTLSEVLTSIGEKCETVDFHFTINGEDRSYKIWPQYLVNDQPAVLTTTVTGNDSIAYSPAALPTAAEIVGHSAEEENRIRITFNGANYEIPTRQFTLTINDQPANPADKVAAGAAIEYRVSPASQPTVSEALLAVKFDPMSLPRGSRIHVLLNGEKTEYTSLVKNGDSLEVVTEE